jgi:predicted XRE-type DNA-binding protein
VERARRGGAPTFAAHLQSFQRARLRYYLAFGDPAMRVRRQSTAEALQLDRLRTEVAIAIRSVVKADGLTSGEASQKTGVHRTEFSRLMNGHIQKFGLERLVYIAIALGIGCSLRLSLPAPGRLGQRASPDKE